MLNAVKAITGKKVDNHATDICHLPELRKVFAAHKDIVGIIHFAAFKSVPESVSNPLSYYQNNLIGLTNMLQCIKDYEVPNFIFSSSCSVYGNWTDVLLH